MKPNGAVNLSPAMDLGEYSLEHAINSLPSFFYRVFVSKETWKAANREMAVLERRLPLSNIRTEISIVPGYDVDEWSVQLCLKDGDEVKIIEEVWTEGV